MMNESNGYKKLSRSAVKAWRINGILWSVFFWLLPAYFVILNLFEGNIALWLIITSGTVALILTLLMVFLLPEVRWRQWRYRVDEHEIDLHHGIWFTRRTLVPVKRVQHVDTRQGPVLRPYSLADVVISTAATTHKIPALAQDVADTVRNDISTFARKAKEDV